MGFIKQLVATLPFLKKRETDEERNMRIVREFIDLTPKQSESVRDSKLLPHPKEDIQKAMLWLMDSNVKTRTVFGPIYLGTACYQNGFKQREAIELLDSVISERESLAATLRQRGYA